MFNIDGCEEFRIKHSQILNQKELVGNINLSIHPMDFWTLSDNDCGWSSCMSWMENDCYPYNNMSLTETVLKWIKELAKTNMNWEYKKEINSFNDSQIRNIRLEDSALYDIDFSCDPMYCDIGSSTHLYSISSKIIDYIEYGKYIHIY